MDVLIAYYSRTGVTRKAAEAIRDALHAAGGANVQVEIEQIVDTKSRKGILGFLGAGKDARLKRAAVIEPIKADVGAFDLVVIGTPVWAFTVAAPVRTFCQEHGKKAKQVAFFCTMGGCGDKGAFREMESVCEKAPLTTLALMERRVKGGHQESFLDKVKGLAEAIAGA